MWCFQLVSKQEPPCARRFPARVSKRTVVFDKIAVSTTRLAQSFLRPLASCVQEPANWTTISATSSFGKGQKQWATGVVILADSDRSLISNIQAAAFGRLVCVVLIKIASLPTLADSRARCSTSSGRLTNVITLPALTKCMAT